jgi:hypothetical protein
MVLRLFGQGDMLSSHLLWSTPVPDSVVDIRDTTITVYFDNNTTDFYDPYSSGFRPTTGIIVETYKLGSDGTVEENYFSNCELRDNRQR